MTTRVGQTDGDQVSPRSVLMVLYFFPPLGGISMSRNVRNVQYLPRHGWTPVVLAPTNPAYPLQDPSAADLIPVGTRVIRTGSIEAGHFRGAVLNFLRSVPNLPRFRTESRTAPPTASSGSADSSPARAGQPSAGILERIRRYVFFPDDQIGWIPFAVAAALRAHGAAPFDAIYSTSSPITAHLIAGILKRRTGLPWIAEFRDPWLGNALASPLPWLHRRLQVKLERWIVSTADRVVGLSPGITDLYRTRYPDAPAMVTITSGYDRGEARQRPGPERADDRFRIVYTGTLDRPRELEIFLEGLDVLLAERPDLTGRFEIAFYGLVSSRCRAVTERFAGRLGATLQFHGFVPRRDALAALADADAALILLGPGPGMGLFIGGKLFDYIGQDLQLLAMLPRGDARNILETLDWGVICDPDPADVGRAIQRLLSLPRPDRPADPAGVYDRQVLAGTLARSLDDVAGGRPARMSDPPGSRRGHPS